MTDVSNNPALPAGFAGFDWQSSYRQLPAKLYSSVHPTPVPAPQLLICNHRLAHSLGLEIERLESAQGVALFSGNALPQGTQPIAQAYAGHQFGYFNPQLGDGRAILLGEIEDQNGALRDIQLKGSGQTPYSRRGDGRAALGPVLREYMISEAMVHLGVPTTQSLAAVTTGEPVFRGDALPGAILTRVASSHIRIGTFEYCRRFKGEDYLQKLADYSIARHYPMAAEAQNPYQALLDHVIDAQAKLVARWLQVGFIHGVMNTDNMAISGETIDYGPCAFMDHYDPETVFSSIDQDGRYAFGNQPPIALWNLTRFAETLLNLLDNNTDRAVAKAEQALEQFYPKFGRHWLLGMYAKLGIVTPEDGDETLVQSFLDLLQAQQADFTQSFRYLSDCLGLSEGNPDRFFALFRQDPQHQATVDEWLQRWRSRVLNRDQTAAEIERVMHSVNPAYIPRNHRVESALTQASEQQSLEEFQQLLAVLQQPFREQPGMEKFDEPAPHQGAGYRTFCGT